MQQRLPSRMPTPRCIYSHETRDAFTPTKSDTRDPKFKTPNTKHQTPNTKHQARNTRHDTRNTQQEKRNTKHEIPNTKYEIRNKKEETPLVDQSASSSLLPAPRRTSPNQRLIFYCRTTSASTASCTSRRRCRPAHCTSYCALCQPLLQAFSGWIRSPPPTTPNHTVDGTGT